ncbi:MAG: Uma2 family endonuclease [Gemmataceae bacterium]
MNDLESFRRWSDSRRFPEVGHIYYYDGAVHVDMSKEQLYTHGAVKMEYAVVLGNLVKAARSGRLWCDSAYVTHEGADLSCVPDFVFVSWEALRGRRVRPIEGRETGYVELEGSPDMALEIVSDSSARKDLVVLRDLYWRSGITEYWIVDARRNKLMFEILRRGPKGYVKTRRVGGWLASQVFAKSFRLTQQTGGDGEPEYTLEVR